MLPSSGTITSGMINVELGRDANAPLNIPDDPDVRTLTGVPSGTITAPDDFWGKSFTLLRPIAWTGDPSQTIGSISPSAVSVGYVIRSNGEVTWNRSPTGGGLLGHWTTPPRFASDGVQVRATIESGGSINGTTGTWVDLNVPNTALSITKTTGTPTNLLFEIRRDGGSVQASWRVTLVI